MADIVGLAERIRDAAGPLRIIGGGTWLHGGGPWADATPLDLSSLRGVVEYNPGDLVITVMAGTTMAELAAVTGEHAQMFALTPYGSPHATIGAVVATAATGPLGFGDYTVRDLVLGVQVLTGTGDITRAGGRVVKNVAGFDLVRLHTGAFGTLGAITEVSLRLHARPAVDVVLAGRLGSADRMALDHLMPRLIANRAPLPMMVHRTPGDAPELWARVSGNPARAAALQQALHALGMGDAREVPPHTMQSALLDTPAEAVVLRARTLRSDALPFVSAALDALPEATVSYDPVRGSLRAVLPSHADHTLDRDIATWSRLAAASGATHALSVVVDQGRTVAAPRRSPRTTLEAGIKRALDPRDVLNRLAPLPASNLAPADV